MTHTAQHTSWLPVAPESHFPIQNLPFGVFSDGGLDTIGVAIGDRILNLAALADSGLLDGICEREILNAPVLNPLLSAGRVVWSSLRARLIELLKTDGDPALRELNDRVLFVPQRDVTMRLPTQIGDYVDFYSSLEHATNLGKLFRPDGDPLMPNWRWMPIGYHGRSATVVIDGTPIHRPCGQRKAPNAPVPTFGPSARLDIELEIGFLTGPANKLGQRIPTSAARDHVFGLVLVNDWSARDIQAWEYQPLGPFLGKSFATTISPWVVTLDALEPFRMLGPAQDPAPLDYLACNEPWSYDIALDVALQTEVMRNRGLAPHVVSRTNYGGMYWNLAQQLAHATANGAIAQPGDLFASGTISGPTPDSLGSFIELSWNGARPLTLPDGQTRSFLQDGDRIIIAGTCSKPGERSIGFGTATGEILPSEAC
ncbi:MAG: fumarylacetoacetase [Vulcanimicrobiaceae bacterium]